MIFAPVLSEVAAAISGTPVETMRSDPARWAYALRDTVELARPDWIVTHCDPGLEADAIAAAADDADAVADVDLAVAEGTAAVAALTETLAAIYPGSTVAASVTAPAVVAGRLAARFGVEDDDERLDLLDGCADLLADHAAALAAHGAGRIIVWDREEDGFGAADRAAALRPLTRRLAMTSVPAVLCAPDEADADGFEHHASPGSVSAALIAPDRFLEAAAIDEVLGPLANAAIALTDGPIPGACELSLIRAAGERAGAQATS